GHANLGRVGEHLDAATITSRDRTKFRRAGRTGSTAGTEPVWPRTHCRYSGFTLLELLVVIGIIALISAMALPVLRSLKPDPLKSASNQLLNDLAYARHRAIADHTTVYVCFMPPVSLLSNLNSGTIYQNLLPDVQQKLLKSQYAGYAMYEKRSIGD